MDEKEKKTPDASEQETKETKKTEKHTDKKEKKEAKQEAKEPKAGKKKKIEELEEEIIRLKEELATSKNAYFKAYADTENLKKRLHAEAENTRKYRIQSFASEILPVLDNLERALEAHPDDEVIAGYVKGFEMIYQQLIAVLEKEGVKEIDALDKPFDANYQQALMQEKKENVEPGIVIEVLQKGYMLKDRVLRAALVKVSE
ncbi:MAG: nucleotide exchange factor GrpE [Erysipelotrichaceae bacterium]|jgi:molecular chaperone GrpE|nr:nucleotide exchange factor GrpE [Erysipelotrichaceae bacterium]